MKYQRDKNGRSLKHVTGYRIRDDRGEYFEMLGTGRPVPPFVDVVALWDRDKNLQYRTTSEIELVGDTDTISLLHFLVPLMGSALLAIIIAAL